MTMAAIALSALLLWQGADDQKAVGLVRDLGAEEFSVRERAESELRRMGDAAIPALREALEDKDPERAFRAQRLLDGLEKKGPRSRSWMAYRDSGRGITFETKPDGEVELTVRETEASGRKVTRTYRADSLEDFKKKHPDLASKYDVDNLVPKEKWTFFDDTKDLWESWNKRFEKDWFRDRDGFGRFALPLFPFGLHLEPRAPVGARTDKQQLGITVERVPGPLADQLSLSADEGLVIAEVKPSSLADQAGLRKHDLLLKVDGKAVTGPEELRRTVEAGLRNGMELEILRRGKRETLKVGPAESSSKK